MTLKLIFAVYDGAGRAILSRIENIIIQQPDLSSHLPLHVIKCLNSTEISDNRAQLKVYILDSIDVAQGIKS